MPRIMTLEFELITNKDDFIINAINLNEEFNDDVIPINKVSTFCRRYYVPSIDCFVSIKYVKNNDMNYKKYIHFQ
jgi:hypothetical protein